MVALTDRTAYDATDGAVENPRGLRRVNRAWCSPHVRTLTTWAAISADASRNEALRAVAADTSMYSWCVTAEGLHGRG